MSAPSFNNDTNAPNLSTVVFTNKAIISNGISFNGGSSSLQKYIEWKPWVPTVVSGTITPVVNSNFYKVTGKTVELLFNFEVNNLTANVLLINNLPLPVNPNNMTSNTVYINNTTTPAIDPCLCTASAYLGNLNTLQFYNTPGFVNTETYVINGSVRYQTK